MHGILSVRDNHRVTQFAQAKTIESEWRSI